MFKTLLSSGWKMLPRSWRWNLLWGFSAKFLLGVTGVVFNARGELLLAHHVLRNKVAWGLPGGGVQHGEPLEHAMHREIMEETGLDVRVGHLLQVMLELERPLLNCYFLCTVEGTPKPTANGELFAAGFYSLDALPAVIDPEQMAVVRYALRVQERVDPPMTIPFGSEK